MRNIKMSKINIVVIIMFLLMGTTTLYSKESWLDTSGISRGRIGIKYANNNDKILKVMIQKGQEKYTYNLLKEESYEYFSLQLGEGTYKITVLENTLGSKYRVVMSETIEVKLENPEVVYLQSIQNVHWQEDDSAIKAGKEMTKASKTKDETTTLLHQDMANKYQYDYNKLATLPSTYLPSIEATFKEKTGICYDFSSLYASMLRSQGVPVKMVKGYSTNAEGYHAWNEVYDVSTGTWYIVDTTYDLQIIKKNPKVAKRKNNKDYQKVYEY